MPAEPTDAQKLSAALARVQADIEYYKTHSALMGELPSVYRDLETILSPAMTREDAQAKAEEITKLWYVAICECRHCVKDRNLLERVASALQSAADAAALQARLEMAGRVAELEAEVEKLKAQICALKFEREMGGHHHA
jgi:hypothetical protein